MLASLDGPYVTFPPPPCPQVEIKPDMVGHYLAEFSISYKPVKHGKPGIGATHSSRFIPLKARARRGGRGSGGWVGGNERVLWNVLCGASPTAADEPASVLCRIAQ